ncbi:MAG: hypothetical protein KC470_03180 [Dehalococcoidia bacterium]|nr:hypothetical protein [Dehalococcoidia bacterium]
MAIALTKPWRPLNEAEVAKLGGHMGVYELGNEDGEVVYVGFAGGKSRFGLKGELMRVLREEPERSTRFRVEVTTAYATRYRELLMAHLAESGALPEQNRNERLPSLGRLSPG